MTGIVLPPHWSRTIESKLVPGSVTQWRERFSTVLAEPNGQLVLESLAKVNAGDGLEVKALRKGNAALKEDIKDAKIEFAHTVGREHPTFQALYREIATPITLLVEAAKRMTRETGAKVSAIDFEDPVSQTVWRNLTNTTLGLSGLKHPEPSKFENFGQVVVAAQSSDLYMPIIKQHGAEGIVAYNA